MTWTAVFTLTSMRDRPEDVAASFDQLIGASLQRALHPGLQARGWAFGPAEAEDHGWHARAVVDDQGKPLGADLVTCPELDEATPDGGALDDRWRVVIGMDLGMLPGTRARRTLLMRRLAGDLQDGCHALGATDLVWEVGGP